METVVNNINNYDTLVITGLILIIVLGILSYNLYFNSNVDSNGNELGCFDTLKNMLGLLPFIETPLKVIDKSIEKTSDLIKNAAGSLDDNIKNVMKKKEVFNIDNSEFTYDQAKLVCKAYDSELATYDQLLEAYKEGANWCNYGWSANQLALYPTQKFYYDELQKGPENLRNSCGKPGINGGYFENKNIKFGVNCWGYKPEADPSKIIYNIDGSVMDTKINNINTIANTYKDQELDQLRNKIRDGLIDVRPFNNEKWSKYSYKKSSYIITPKNLNFPEVNHPVVVQEEKTEAEKDPHSLTFNITVENDDVI